MRALLDTRLAESRFVVASSIAAGVLWVLAVLLVAADLVVLEEVFAAHMVVAGLMATSALMVAGTAAVVRSLRIEHEVSRLLTSAMVADLRVSNSEQLRALLLRDVNGEPVVPAPRGAHRF